MIIKEINGKSYHFILGCNGHIAASNVLSEIAEKKDKDGNLIKINVLQ